MSICQGEGRTRMAVHLARASKRRGFGWKRWSKQRLYGSMKLFDSYQGHGELETCVFDDAGRPVIGVSIYAWSQNGR